MKTSFPVALALVLVAGWSVEAAATQKDQVERLANAADAVKEILALPEGIPAEILGKADCVLVFPSVKKLALGFGGSYGKGAMLCRCGDDFQGPWGRRR